jgi:SPP1 gp7 family putative phage head morphogenesis protein
MRIPFLSALFAGTISGKGVGDHTIYEAAARQRRLVLAGEQKAVNRVLGAWKEAKKGIDQKLVAVTKKIQEATTNGQAVSQAWLYQQHRWTEFLVSIEKEIDSYSKAAAEITTEQQAVNVRLGAKHAKDLAKVAGVKVGFTMLPDQAFTDLVGFLTDKSPLHELFKQLGPDAVTTARAIFAQEMAAGSNPRKIAKRFRDELEMTKTRSVLIARTETLRSYRTAAQRNYENNSHVVIAGRWSSSRDSRTCYLCLAKDGTIIEHGQDFPAHPGCRCAIVPVVKFLDVDRGTGEEWLTQQPEEVQKKKLGPGRYNLWKSGDASLQDMVRIKSHPRWGKSIQSVPISQIKANVASGIKAAPQKLKVEGMGLIAKPFAPPSAAPAVAPVTEAVQGIDASKLALKFPAPPSQKTLATDYTKKLINEVGHHMSPDELSALVKHYYPLSTSSGDSVLALYQKSGVAPKGGFPSGYAFTPPVAKVAEAVPTAIAPPADTVILAKKIGEQEGSNPGGLYMGSDGVQRYVKFYPDKVQAYCEHISNEIYRGLGQKAPVSVLFEHSGQITYASEVLPTVGTVGAQGLTKALATEVLDGFAADVLTANWDAVGSGLDNVVLLKDGGVAKIDQGGTLLFRAKSGYKADQFLNAIPEWQGFFDAGLNLNYFKVTQAAGLTQAEQIAGIQKQVSQIVAFRKKWGSWSNFVAKNAPGLDPAVQQRIASMLEARTTLLVAKANAAKRVIKAAAAAQKLAKAQEQAINKLVIAKNPRKLTMDEDKAKKEALFAKLWSKTTQAQREALDSYKDSGYEYINDVMRGKRVADTWTKAKIDAITEVFKKAPLIDEDLWLYRGNIHLPWANLDEKHVGKYISDVSFISSTSKESLARSWKSGQQGKYTLKIRIPKGSRAIPVHNPAYYDSLSEEEWLFHGVQLMIVSVTKTGGPEGTLIECELHATLEGARDWKWLKRLKKK